MENGDSLSSKHSQFKKDQHILKHLCICSTTMDKNSRENADFIDNNVSQIS